MRRGKTEKVATEDFAATNELHVPNAELVAAARNQVLNGKVGWTSRPGHGKVLIFYARKREHRRVFHGLRKSAVVFLLEAGCTDAEVCAITRQSREMVEYYALQVNQRKLAAAAILKWEVATQARTENERDDSL